MQTSELTPRQREQFWPALPYDEWKETAQTLRLWTQVVGKVRLTLTPWINHSWHVTLYVTSRGLTTSPIPDGFYTFEIEFDFIDHELRISKSDGSRRRIELRAQPVASFHSSIMRELEELGVAVEINGLPNELPEVIPFDQDETHHSYDREYANRFWRVLVQADRVFKRFRSRFCGKSSPAHFFWGGFDLAVTRFSGRPAPPHPGGVPHLPDTVTREAYAQEVSSLGFWPGDEHYPSAAFYSYVYPEPQGFGETKVQPATAFYSKEMREFLLPYDEVRAASSPDDAILDFAQSVYDRVVTLSKWDRERLDESTLNPPGPTG
jgi:Family of unknown function (DUF5996)